MDPARRMLPLEGLLGHKRENTSKETGRWTMKGSLRKQRHWEMLSRGLLDVAGLVAAASGRGRSHPQPFSG